MIDVAELTRVVVDVTELTREVVLSELLYGDDLVLKTETINGMQNKSKKEAF